MSLTVALQIDPLDQLSWATDSGLLLAAEAEKRGARLFAYQAEHLSWQPGVLSVPARPISRLRPPSAEHEAGPESLLDLTSVDVILIRQDPPVDIPYLTATWLLELAGSGVLVVNDPRGVRDTPEKLIVQRFPDLAPPTLITRNLQAIADFREVHGEVVLKPLYGFGGHGVFHLKPEDDNAAALIEMMLANSRDPLIVQRYLPEVRAGDKRIILIEGEPVGAISRIPPARDFRANIRIRADVKAAPLTPRDRTICAALAPWLKEHGIVLAGIDVVGDWLLEVNVTSPSCLAELHTLTGINAAALFWDAVEARLRKR